MTTRDDGIQAWWGPRPGSVVRLNADLIQSYAVERDAFGNVVRYRDPAPIRLDAKKNCIVIAARLSKIEECGTSFAGAARTLDVSLTLLYVLTSDQGLVWIPGMACSKA